MAEAAGISDPAERERAWLLEYLRDRDVPCPLCGYNLRQLDSARCPECGREIRLSVNLAEPYLRAWLTTAIALCASAGMGVIVLMISFQEGLPPLRLPPSLVISLYSFMLSIPVAIGALWGRRRFMRLGRRSQGLIACAVVLFVVCALTAFFMGLDR
jgi:hypothetical protein